MQGASSEIAKFNTEEVRSVQSSIFKNPKLNENAGIPKISTLTVMTYGR